MCQLDRSVSDPERAGCVEDIVQRFNIDEVQAMHRSPRDRSENMPAWITIVVWRQRRPKSSLCGSWDRTTEVPELRLDGNGDGWLRRSTAFVH